MSTRNNPWIITSNQGRGEEEEDEERPKTGRWMRVGLPLYHRQRLSPSLGGRSQHLDQLWSRTVPQPVAMGCNMCVVQKPEDQYRVMFQVSAPPPPATQDCNSTKGQRSLEGWGWGVDCLIREGIKSL